jgi:hypothetical protein
MAKPKLTDSERVQRGRIAANSRWGRTVDRTAATAPGRRAFIEKFEREADPDGTLDPVLRAKLAENLRRAYYQQLSFRSSRARQARKAGAAND